MKCFITAILLVVVETLFASGPLKSAPSQEPINLYSRRLAAKVDPSTGKVTLEKGADIALLVEDLVRELQVNGKQLQECLNPKKEADGKKQLNP